MGRISILINLRKLETWLRNGKVDQDMQFMESVRLRRKNSLTNKFFSGLVVAAMTFNLSAQTVDIDTDNNGIVDADAQTTNLLQNPGFENQTDNWVVNDVATFDDLGPLIDTSNLIIGEMSSAIEANFYQEILLADVGFDDLDALEAALADNAMQVVFGGYVNSITNGQASFRLFFINDSDDTISHVDIDAVNIFQWDDIDRFSNIPAGTRKLRFSVDIEDNGASTNAQVKLDDLFVNLRIATDADSDGVEDVRDIDSDNDGLVDEDKTGFNLLKNGDFDKSQAYWNRNDVGPFNDNGLFNDPNNILVGELSTAIDATLSQIIDFADLGLTNNQGFADNTMQLKFGGLVESISNGYASIELIFEDSSQTALGNALIPQINIYQWDDIHQYTRIPAGTTRVRFSVSLTDNNASTNAQVKLDDLYVYLLRAIDSDSDGVDDSRDIDVNNDGVVDIDKASVNLLRNADFQKSQAYWTRNDVGPFTQSGRTIDESNILVGELSSAIDASISQTITLADFGLTDNSEFANNAVQFVFGGWIESISNGYATIEVVFSDDNGTGVGNTSIPLINTIEWQQVNKTVAVPAGTTSVSYTVSLVDNGASTNAQVQLDDLFVHLQPAVDSDADGVADAQDIDSDNDGVVDASASDTNILNNPNFDLSLTYWQRNDVGPFVDNGHADSPNNILIGELSTAEEASLEQDITLADLGFTDASALQSALAANAMQVVLSAWVNTDTSEENMLSLRLHYLDASDASVGVLEILDASYAEWTQISADSVMPEGTVALRLIATIEDNGASTNAQVKLDNVSVKILNIADDDNDGLNNYQEEQLGTDPNNADSDGDGLSDGDEVNVYNTEPMDSDSDDDGLSDGQEINEYNTDPNTIDSDGDGITDGAEVNVYFSDPANADTDNDGINDSTALMSGLAINGKYHNLRSRVAWAHAELNVVVVDWQVSSSALVTGEQSFSFGVSYDSEVLTLDQTLNAQTLEVITTTSSETLTAQQSVYGHDTLVSVPVQNHTPGSEWTTIVKQYFTLNSELLYGTSASINLHNVNENVSEVLTRGTGTVVSIQPLSLDINDDNDVTPHLDGFILQRFMAAYPDAITAEELVEDGEQGNRSKEQILLMLQNAARKSND